jgi:hypothetical protein
MSGHPVGDNSKTWTYLENHKPQELIDFLSTHPERFDLDFFNRRFNARKGGASSNTNGKNRVRTILAFWTGQVPWREAFTYDIQPTNGDDSWDGYTNWYNLRLVPERKKNEDVLAKDFEEFTKAGAPILDAIRTAEAGQRLICQLSKKAGFSDRNKQHDGGDAMFCVHMKHSCDAEKHAVGYENGRNEEAKRLIKRRADEAALMERHKPDGFMVSQSFGFSYEMNSTSMWDQAFVEEEKFAIQKVHYPKTVYVFVVGIGEATAKMYACWVEDITFRQIIVWTTPGKCAQQVADEMQQMREKYPKAKVFNRTNKNGSGKTSVVVKMKFPVLPLDDFIRENFDVNPPLALRMQS